ncbi:MAG: stage V sporulation protein D [Clostridia bacterium]|nr:stage V sporulation protein D [Clostridia bacterium]
MSLGFAFLFLVLFVQFFLIQIVRRKTLGYRAIGQWTRELPVVAQRGVIRDRNGVVLAGNLPTYTVYVRRNAVEDKERVIEVLSELFSIEREELRAKMQKSVSEFAVARQISKEQAERLNGYSLKGVYYAPDAKRVYPYESLLCQVLGFTSSDSSGVSGLEKYYDDYLKGKDGEILYETDLVGVDVGDTLLYREATAGLDLTLTVDYKIQTIAERVMEQAYVSSGAKNAECLLLDLDSFGILAMASFPSYDLNEVPRDDISLLTSLSRNGLVSNSYEPGSTFKVVTAAANLQEYLNGNPNAFSPSYIFSASRTRSVDGTTVKCWSDHSNGKHSHQTIAEALNNSCNPCFTDMALSLGSECFYSYLDKFGFGKTTGIDFPGEALGMLLPSVTVRNCDLARIGFGQSVAVTALQLACAVGAAVNGGNYYVPHLVSGIGDVTVKPELKSHPIGEEASSFLRSMLEGVVRDGSGKKAFIDGYRIGGKTGTAQKYENGHIASGKYVSSFVGFYPADNPKTLVLVIIDEPQGAYYGSVVAAPCAKEIFSGIIALEEG